MKNSRSEKTPKVDVDLNRRTTLNVFMHKHIRLISHACWV